MSEKPQNEKQISEMTEAELADYYFSHRHDSDMVGEQVAYAPPRGQRVAVRLSVDEERRVRQAAEAAGMTVSAFLRQAALDAAAKGNVVDIERLRRDVEEARLHIDDAWQALA